MKIMKFLVVGVFFGIILTKSEAISWFRIYEMFRFESFHMYGIISSAVALGVGIIWVIKKYKFKSISKQEIQIPDKEKGWRRYLFGGTVFGLGWALAGACPGPLYALIGYGFSVILVVLVSAIFGTFVYGLVKEKLPH